MRIMALKGVMRRSTILLAGMVFLAGCSLQSGPKLDAADLRFASFYSDYLVRSGVSAPDSTAKGVAMSSAGLDSLFLRHGLDQKSFDAKIRAYSKDPQLWREVLVQVRRNLRKQP